VYRSFSKNSGKAKFIFDFNNGTDFSMDNIFENDDQAHVNVLGSIYSGEFSNDEVEIGFKMSPNEQFKIDKNSGSIQVNDVNATIVKKSSSSLVDNGCKE
jgi:hypothetical protein